jgi:hypothetical protein
MAQRDSMGRLLYFFTTHPYPKDRVTALEQYIEREGYLIDDPIPLEDLPTSGQDG